MADGVPHSSKAANGAIEVLIAGGGVAALEAALALGAQAGERVRLTLLTPALEFVYRPVGVLEPYVHKPPRRLSLAEFAENVNAAVIHDTLASVDPAEHVVHTAGGRQIRFDALLIAIGARAQQPPAGAIALDPTNPDPRLNDLAGDIRTGEVRSVAFVAPAPTWPLPAYELALLAREQADEVGAELRIKILTAEQSPLEIFGDQISQAITGVVAQADIEVTLGAAGEPPPLAEFDRVIAIPRLQGPGIEGLPATADGFLAITPGCRVVGVEAVYAAGDATDFPVKFGAIAAQQADAAAESIAASAGVALEPAPFDGVVHGVVFSRRRGGRIHFRARITDGGAVDAHVGDTAKLAPGAKIAARYLGPYLDGLWGEGARWLAGQLAMERSIEQARARDAG